MWRGKRSKSLRRSFRAARNQFGSSSAYANTRSTSMECPSFPARPKSYLELPRHGIWCRHASAEPDFLELLLDEIDDGFFRFRRDEAVTLGLGQGVIDASRPADPGARDRPAVRVEGPWRQELGRFSRCPAGTRR